MLYETILVDTSPDHVATVTLNRPHAMNSFNQTMCDEFEQFWKWVRNEDEIHAVVVRAAGDRAFCTGVDVKEGLNHPANPWYKDDPGLKLGPKANKVWKPVIVAVNGMAAGGAFYWLNEADVAICAEDATFFDPHVNYGMVASLEPIGLARRVPLGEVLRMSLLGLQERMSAETAMRIGLVTEITLAEDLWQRAHELAAAIARNPPLAVQGTVRAVWESLDTGRSQALARGMSYTQIGSPEGIRTRDGQSKAERLEPWVR